MRAALIIVHRFRHLLPPTNHADSLLLPMAKGGLGLHLAAELTQVIGGVIDCTSTPGKGTEMTLRLPRVKWTSGDPTTGAGTLSRLIRSRRASWLPGVPFSRALQRHLCTPCQLPACCPSAQHHPAATLPWWC